MVPKTYFPVLKIDTIPFNRTEYQKYWKKKSIGAPYQEYYFWLLSFRELMKKKNNKTWSNNNNNKKDYRFSNEIPWRSFVRYLCYIYYYIVFLLGMGCDDKIQILYSIEIKRRKKKRNLHSRNIDVRSSIRVKKKRSKFKY